MKKGSKLKRLILSILTILVLVPGVLTPCMSVSSAPDNVYWVGDAGNWTDDDNHWALTSGGAPADGNLPGDNTNVHFDENSFTTSGQTVTIDDTAICKDINWTGATNSPTLVNNSNLDFYGDVTFIADMTITNNGTIGFRGSVEILVTTNGVTITGGTINTGSSATFTGSVVLQDDFTTTGTFNHRNSLLNTNGKTLSCGSFGDQASTTNKTLTLGASTINCTAFSFPSAGLTVTANTATINCNGNFSSAGYNYNGATVNLTGATSTITGNNTFAQLNLVSGTTQTVTFTDGTTQTITSDADLSGSSGHIHTLKGSGTSGWNLRYTGDGYLNYDYLSLSYSTATPDLTWYAGENSIDGTHNAGWYYIDLPWPPPISSIVDIADAQYMGSIRAPNSSYTAMDVGVPFDLDTDNMIDSGYINGDCSNTALTLPDGTPIPYMPAVEGFDDWVFYISQITQNSVQNYNLYTGGDTDMDGDIVYFPGDGGMTVADDAGLEPGDSFGIEVSGFIDTSSGSDKNIVFKEGAFQLYVSDDEEINGKVYSDSSPVVVNTNTYVGGSGTSYPVNLPSSLLSDNLIIIIGTIYNSSPVLTTPIGWILLYTETYNNVKQFCLYKISDGTEGATLTLNFSSTVTNIATVSYQITGYSGVPVASSLNSGSSVNPDPPSLTTSFDNINTLFFAVTSYPGNAAVSTYPFGYTNGINLQRYYCSQGIAQKAVNVITEDPETFTLASSSYWLAKTIAIQGGFVEVSSESVPSGEYIVKVTADGTDINLYIDGVLADTAALDGVSVTDNTNDWVLFENGSVLYLRSAKVSIGGTLRGYWVWENSTIFTDLSGNENHATPTFRNVSSDADVSASLIAFTPIATAVYEAEEEVISPIITTTLTAPDGLYEASGVRLPGADLINELLDTADIPHTLFWYPLLFGMAALLGLLTYFFARDIMIQSVVNGACLAFFGIMNGIPFWGVIPFILMALAVVISRKTVSL